MDENVGKLAVFSAFTIAIMSLVGYLLIPLLNEYTSEWIQVVPWLI